MRRRIPLSLQHRLLVAGPARAETMKTKLCHVSHDRTGRRARANALRNLFRSGNDGVGNQPGQDGSDSPSALGWSRGQDLSWNACARGNELRTSKSGSDTYVIADVNGDGKTDFAIHTDKLVTPDKADGVS